jgi:hypothetical protein
MLLPRKSRRERLIAGLSVTLRQRVECTDSYRQGAKYYKIRTLFGAAETSFGL